MWAVETLGYEYSVVGVFSTKAKAERVADAYNESRGDEYVVKEWQVDPEFCRCGRVWRMAEATCPFCQMQGKTMQEQQYGPCHRCGESTETDKLCWDTGYPLCPECIDLVRNRGYE